MMRKQLFFRVSLLALLITVAALNLVGCRYAVNRTHDLADVFQVGVGITAENPISGMAPPSLGIHAQVTEFLNLGAIHFSGLTAEWDGRGFFAGPETRTRFGFLPMQLINVGQDYALGYENYFKKPDTLWSDRMNSMVMRFWDAPAKELDYVFWADRLHQGSPLFHRGWQYWENVSLEVAVSEPFLTHLGLHVRLGVDVSEISDWLLGFFMIDFKADDLTTEEFNEMIDISGHPARDRKPASDADVVVKTRRVEIREGETSDVRVEAEIPDAPGSVENMEAETRIETRTIPPVQLDETGENAPTTR